MNHLFYVSEYPTFSEYLISKKITEAFASVISASVMLIKLQNLYCVMPTQTPVHR